jgi:hypothetical protein
MIASSLFHFTKDVDTVIKIISSGEFRASYNIEDVSDFYPSEKYVAIPMVCFCDIPLKSIVDVKNKHTDDYGKFGIGLDKEQWGLKNGINPILYRTESHVNALLIDTLSATDTDFIKGLNLDSEKEISLLYRMTRVKDNMLRLANYTKKYQIDVNIYYLEREWRYVPESSELLFLNKNDEKERKLINEEYWSNNPDYVPFDLKDIKYIIVPSKIEVEEFIHKVQNMNIEENKKYKLIQLIIDLDSIDKDF